MSDLDVVVYEFLQCFVLFLQILADLQLVEYHRLHNFICIDFVIIDLILQIFQPGFLHLNLLFLLPFPNFHISTLLIIYGSLIVNVRLFLFFLTLDNSVHFEVVLFLWHLLPFRDLDHIIFVHIDLLLADFFEVLPLLLLLYAHHVALGRFVVLGLRNGVDKAGIARFFADINFPHFILLAITATSVTFFPADEVFSKYEILFIWKLDWSAKHAFCSFGNELMNGSLSAVHHLVSILLHLLFKFRSFLRLWNVRGAQQGILLADLSLGFFGLLRFDPLKLDGPLLVLQMQASLLMFLNLLFAIRQIDSAILAPLLAAHPKLL